MAGGGEGESTTTLEYTPTWVVACVCTLIVGISLPVERAIHYTGKAKSLFYYIHLTMDLNVDLLCSADPGPIDGSILVLQRQHRSKKVWDADYAGVDVVDDSSIGIMFDVADKITGYTPVLFTETMDAMM
ncbi:hypothetical protein RHGRI_011110 [Rhododendron griersonianum]|uniref:Uncharacterized protein n=1 Tax=Rhododendron griersonianum TaxID=479676 RepID=A0AAV6KKM3_9ERIC|nr:hypothetical protein RHGRI_011110 [Rhododendron griersonianum]